MPPTLQRRHGPRCSGGHPAGSFSFETEELRKNWKRCSCRIYAHGTLAGVFYRLATRQRDFASAREVLAPYLAAGRWDLPQAPPPTPPSAPLNPPAPPPEPGGLSIADAIKICLDEHRDLKSAKNTIRKYRYMLSALARFSEQSGLRYLAEWKPVHVREFRASWGNGLSTIRVKMRNLKSFFEIFVEDQRLEYNPARLRLPKNRAARESTPSSQKNPYTNAELERMFAACTHLGQSALRRQPKRIDGRRVVSITPYRQYHRRWTGADLADFMEISVYTGLRICDVATFHISRLTPAGEVNVRCTKNGNWVGVWVPPFLRAIIRERAARYGPEIFGRHRTADVDVITSGWRRRLEKVWELAGPWESKPSHHRFRHTFVRILLERHTPIPLIAELIGDSEAAIRRHYAAWNKERQEQTSRLLEQAFSHMPRFRQA